MKLNENTVICGDKVVLVPYRAEHVPTYHEWMKSDELLELTASEPLSLEEEYEMQRKWHTDADKLTFILLARSPDLDFSTHPILTPDQIRQCRMVGDVNMFLPDGVEGDGECEIMIASPDDRRKGFAREALQLFLSYATSHLPLAPSRLIARIGTSNTSSIALFTSLGFGVVRVVEVFGEAEMRWGWAGGAGADAEADEGVGVGEGGVGAGVGEGGDGAQASATSAGGPQDETSTVGPAPSPKPNRDELAWGTHGLHGRIGVYDA